ncbi:MAG: shikimate dehydrogenase [Kofleriaceae bacterium]
MKTAAVIGWPIEHSRSPTMIDAAFAACGIEAEMIKVGVAPAQFAAKLAELRALPMLGASVTTPHKLAAHDLCDELASAARAIGAVNCLQLAGTRLVGHNTDAPGFVDAALAAGLVLAGARVVLLGAGGAARAVAYGCRGAGAHVTVAARTPSKVAWTAAQPWSELAALLRTAQLVVDCTSTALAGATGELEVPLEALPAAATVATLAYHARTELLERARASGHATLDGRAMLLHQGARAFTLWTGVRAPLDVMAAALRA